MLRRAAIAAVVVLPLASGLAGARNGARVPRCHTSDLRIYLTRVGAAAGTLAGDVAFRNRSAHSCFVYGYAGLGLEDAQHRVEPSRVIWGSTVARRDPGPHRVVLLPGRAAFTNLSWGDVEVGSERCRTPRWLEVTPPDERTFRRVPFRAMVCNHGKLTATALSARRTPR